MSIPRLLRRLADAIENGKMAHHREFIQGKETIVVSGPLEFIYIKLGKRGGFNIKRVCKNAIP